MLILLLEQLKEKIEKLVPEYMIPGKVIYLENMPS